MSHIVIGLNAFHADSAAALIVDGQLCVAAEEERFRRIKHWSGFPSEAIKFCLQEAGVSLADVNAIALNTDPQAARGKRLWYGLKNRPSLKLVWEKLKTRQERLGVAEHLQKAFPGQLFGGQIMAIEHHLAHLASAFYVSPFEQALAVSVDGFGDFASAAFGLGQGQDLAIDGHIYFPHSLGIFYQAMTQYLGFSNYGDEYKVMGLAPYGKPTMVDQLGKLVGLQEDGSYALALNFFRHHQASVTKTSVNGEPLFDCLYSDALVQLLGPARQKQDELTQHHKDLAASVQRLYEKAFFHLLNTLQARYGVEQLTLAGGCAQNSVANGKITVQTPFKSVYVAASGADAGGAIGAGLAAARRLGQVRSKPVLHAYLGTRYSTEQCQAVIEQKRTELTQEQISVRLLEQEQELCNLTVAHIERGHVVGWFQDRMEWGPRALGNRSILADPRRADVKDILNLKIKRRESFRPFAPSILRAHVAEWFELDADVPFMAQVFPIRAEKQQAIPAVTHVDGSGRLQTVEQHHNPRYFRLIDTFRQKTGVPILVNTSFNENEPVVCRPEEALACFLRTKMDVLVLGDWVLERVQVAHD